jgi:glutathione S-transferase
MLEEGSLVLFHSNAILRYLADKSGLYGHDTTERAECDMWAEQCELIQQTLWNAEFMKYSEVKYRQYHYNYD